jgi:hypothetical protein
MKLLFTAICLLSIAFLVSCDVRSGTAKEEMDKFSGTPTPTVTPAVMSTPTPIDPADIVQVDTTLEGDTLTVNGSKQNKTLTCKKFDQVMINASASVVTVSGVCRQIIVNGDGNQITADAAMEFVFNGTENSLKYARFANGRQPIISENQPGNIIEKIAFEPGKTTPNGGKNKK